MESRGRIRVLIADDDTSFAAYLAQLAAERGLEVIGTVPDGAAAVEAAARLEPDVVLMDLDMPGLDGANATREIIARDPHIRVVIVSGSDVVAHIHDALFVGAVAHVRKAEVERHLPPILDSLA
jgi:DNA-binding NarL/FixJ family response regulator